MTTKYYKKVKELGIFIFLGLFIVYCCINFCITFLFFNSWITNPLSNWIFFGPLIIFQYAGFFISMYLVSGKELPDESDTAKIHERCTGLKASVAGFITWFIALIILDYIQVQINIFLSIFCGYALSLVIFWLLKRIDKRYW
ncbi:ABC-type glycerol-3-phosphate transport system permease component [Methanomicrobium sp. W14]|nr:ABC-type glycerol-3-phosphate transport system permease component [Methanomicrobium sp. W14]